MRIPNAQHESCPWRIRDIASDFTLEDVWALPVNGGAEDFDTLVEVMASLDPGSIKSPPARLVWQVRDRLGAWFDLGRISTESGGRPETLEMGRSIPGVTETSLVDRLPDDLRKSTTEADWHRRIFAPVYRTDREFAAELSNRTVHAVMHLAWVEQDRGRYQGQMAVYVKPRGRLGRAYLALIKPFRYFVIYPELMHRIEQAWNTRHVH